MTLNFTVGPVTLPESVRLVASEQVPYFRTDDFSILLKENEKMILEMVHAPIGSRALFITGSGTASMEASVINIFNKNDKLLIVNGGSFGERFVQICQLYEIPYQEIRLRFGESLTIAHLEEYSNQGYTGLLINVDETSSGVRYDMNLIGSFCKANSLILISDIISSFLADPNDMCDSGSDVLIISSQKALACHPGVSIIVLSPQALKRIDANTVNCLYLNLKLALKDGERGQTPFTPAVNIICQINARLKEIISRGGVDVEINSVRVLAEHFRTNVSDLPLTRVTNQSSNAVTAYYISKVDAYQLFIDIKRKYDIWICPNGGEHKHDVFRVGHIGNLTIKDNEQLIIALREELSR